MPKRQHWLTDSIPDYRGAEMSWQVANLMVAQNLFRFVNREESSGRHKSGSMNESIRKTSLFLT